MCCVRTNFVEVATYDPDVALVKYFFSTKDVGS